MCHAGSCALSAQRLTNPRCAAGLNADTTPMACTMCSLGAVSTTRRPPNLKEASQRSGAGRVPRSALTCACAAHCGGPSGAGAPALQPWPAPHSSARGVGTPSPHRGAQVAWLGCSPAQHVVVHQRALELVPLSISLGRPRPCMAQDKTIILRCRPPRHPNATWGQHLPAWCAPC